MAIKRLNHPIEPMTLGNMRDDVPVPTFGPRMVCTKCGTIGADVRPNWQEQAPRETLTAVQWR
jgi:hypothetical protein